MACTHSDSRYIYARMRAKRVKHNLIHFAGSQQGIKLIDHPLQLRLLGQNVALPTNVEHWGSVAVCFLAEKRLPC